MSQKRKRRSTASHVMYEIDTSNDSYDDIVTVPNPDDSGSDSSDFDADSGDEIANITYKEACKTYTEDQTKLEGDHVFNWVEGEKKYHDDLEDEILLKESTKKKIRESKPVELFETFFSTEMKQYIINACKENNFDLNLKDLNTFVGIVILTSFNKRKSQRDYWSTDPFLSCDVVASAMTRDKFEEIKLQLKYSKAKDQNHNDYGWRVRTLLNLFQTNILKFGIWRTALSIDEMMAKSYARTALKQFIRGKPIRFGLKFWGLCTSDGFVLGLHLYCGKKSTTGNKFSKCALGSRVVMNLLQPFFGIIPTGKISQFHLYFDNYFTSLDLIVHLKKLGLKCTGTIREDRVKDKNIMNKKAQRGEYVVKHDKNSGMNYITVMDSKPVSIVSTAAGVTPLSPSKRYSAQERSKVEILFPKAVRVYNCFMGGNDVHDGHCNNLLPSIRSKKWTWVVFIRLIQASIVNATVIFNAASTEEKKVGTKDFAISIAKSYINQGRVQREEHKITKQTQLKLCSNCPIRTRTICKQCAVPICISCFKKNH